MEGIIGPLSFALLNGVVWGLILALLALGLGLIYTHLRWLNLAHGTFYMLGAMVGWRLGSFTSFWGALAIAPVITGSLGMLSERVLFRYTRDLKAIMVMGIGLMLLIQGLTADLFGATPRAVELPFAGRVEFFDRQFSHYRLFVGAFSLLLILSTWSFLKYTRFGLWIRAAGQDRGLALNQGIPVPRVLTLTYGFGVGLAGLAGVLISPLIGVHPLMGMEILVLALIIVIAGRGPWGAVWIAMALSVLENLVPTLSQLVIGELVSPTLIRALILSALVIGLVARSISERETP